MKSFAAPRETLGDLRAEAAARLIATAADIAIVVGEDGVIRDFAVDRREFGVAGLEAWVGRPWVETVTDESRAKIEALIHDAFSSERTRWRQVNHRSPQGPDVPVLYSVLKIPESKSLIAFGRDLRTISSLQQRLIEAQQALEKDYARLRHLETRYRLLFQLSGEPVLVVDGATDKVLEANPAALAALDGKGRGIVGRPIADCFDAAAAETVETLLTTVRATGRADEIDLPAPEGEGRFRAAVSLLRQDSNWVFLVRLSVEGRGFRPEAAPGDRPDAAALLAGMPDGFVTTTPDGVVIDCNASFLDMVQAATGDQVRGQSLDRWLGRPGVDLSVMLANLSDRGALRFFATVLRGEYGTETDVEISASAATHGGKTSFGFLVRDVSRRLAPKAGAGEGLSQSVEQLTELVGRVSLKDVVRQTTDMIEKMYIEAALEMTGDNRASAAELLGLSRQSLYVKLRRFGIRDLPEHD